MVVNTCCVCGCLLNDINNECAHCTYEDLNNYGDSRAAIIAKLRKDVENRDKEIKKLAFIISKYKKGRC